MKTQKQKNCERRGGRGWGLPPFEHLVKNFCQFYAFTIGPYEFCSFFNVGLTPPPFLNNAKQNCRISKEIP